MSQPHPALRALQALIAERQAEDPLIAPKVAAHELYTRVFAALRGDHGVPVEPLLGILASLAGYACQVAVRLKARDEGFDEAARLVAVEGRDGRVAWFGDALNRPLLEDRHSVWSLAAGGAQGAGLALPPDPEPIVARVAASVGTPAFGRPQARAAAQLTTPPAELVRVFWSGARAILAPTCSDPMHWPIACGIAVQRAIEQGAAALPPADALELAMECAIAMAKLDLGRLDAFALAERPAVP